jgi:hypothetical protein
MNHRKTLGSRLTTMKKTMTSKSKSTVRISDAQTLYVAVLTAVAIPVLGGPVNTPLVETDIKSSSNSVALNNTIYICQSSMELVQEKVLQRVELMDAITTVEAKAFCATGKRFDDLIKSKCGYF